VIGPEYNFHMQL